MQLPTRLDKRARTDEAGNRKSVGNSRVVCCTNSRVADGKSSRLQGGHLCSTPEAGMPMGFLDGSSSYLSLLRYSTGNFLVVIPASWLQAQRELLVEVGYLPSFHLPFLHKANNSGNCNSFYLVRGWGIGDQFLGLVVGEFLQALIPSRNSCRKSVFVHGK